MSPRVYRTNFNAEMPALVRTHSSSSTDSSAPSTPVTESDSPFKFDDRVTNLKAVRIEVPISSQTSSSQTGRRCVAYHPREQVKTNNDSMQLVQMLFLLAMLLVDVVRVLSWVPICSWIIMGEVWVVAKHELQIDVEKAVGNTVTVAVLAMIVGFLLL